MITGIRKTNRTGWLAMIAAVALLVQASFPVFAQNAASEQRPSLRPAGAPVPGGVNQATHSAVQPIPELFAKQPGTGTHESVTVHGHWVIDVRNPDGSLAQHRDFENSLESSAQGTLAGLIGGQFSMGNMMIAMGYSGAQGPCQATVSFPGWCAVVVNLSTHPAVDYCSAYVCAPTLTETFNSGTNYAGPYNLVLTGSITANAAGTVNSVYTIFGSCANIPFGGNGPTTFSTTSPANCATGVGTPNYWVGPLTQANIPGVSVSSGQIIQVTVTLTFG